MHAAGAGRRQRGDGRHGARHRVRHRHRRVLRAVSHELRRGAGRAVAQAIGRGHRHRVPGIHRAVLRLPVLWALRVRAVLRQHGPGGRGVSVLRGFQLADRQEAGQRVAAPSRSGRPCRASPAAPLDLRVRPDDARVRRILRAVANAVRADGAVRQQRCGALRRRTGLHHHADRHRIHRRGARAHHLEGRTRPRGVLPPYHHVFACRRVASACADAVPQRTRLPDVGSSSPVYAAAIRPRACSRSGLSGPHGRQARSWVC